MDLISIVSALRSKMRFSSTRGLLTIEQLFDVPLRAKDGFSLDAIAQAQARVVRDLESGSFVDGTANAQLQAATAVLTVVKYVIGVLLAEENARLTAAARRAEEQRILQALQARQDQKLAGATEDELMARLKEIRAA